MAERLDEERLEILRNWGVGLSADSREELRAAGKAITLLIDEIEHLQVDVWHARAAGAPSGTPEPASEPAAEPAEEQPSAEELSTSLRDRLSAVLPSLSAKSDR